MALHAALREAGRSAAQLHLQLLVQHVSQSCRLLPCITADCRSTSIQSVLQGTELPACSAPQQACLPTVSCLRQMAYVWHFSALQHQSQLLALVLTVSCRIEYTIEVMKGGASLEKRSVHTKDHYTFGRNPECDFHLEHPSISRVHAVLQYKAEGEHAVLAGSRLQQQQKDGGVQCMAEVPVSYTMAAFCLGSGHISSPCRAAVQGEGRDTAEFAPVGACSCLEAATGNGILTCMPSG